MMSILADGTVPELSMASGDAAQTIQPGNIVYKSGTAPDPEVSVTGALHGSSIEDQATIYVVEIPASHPSFASAYNKATAFTALTDVFSIHRLSVGDRHWAIMASASHNESDILVCGADGVLVQGKTGGDTADKWNVHTWRAINVTSSKAWILVEYMGLGSADTD